MALLAAVERDARKHEEVVEHDAHALDVAQHDAVESMALARIDLGHVHDLRRAKRGTDPVAELMR